MPSRRIERLNEQLRADLAELISREMKDPRIAGLVSITSVDLSPDLRNARIFVSVLGTDDDRKHTIAGLKSAAGFLRTRLAARMTTKRAPELQFNLDSSIEQGARIMQLIRQVELEPVTSEPSGPGEADDRG